MEQSRIERIDRCAAKIVMRLQDRTKKHQRLVLKELKKGGIFDSWAVGRAIEILEYGEHIESYESYKRVRAERLSAVLKKQVNGKEKPCDPRYLGDSHEAGLGLILLQGEMSARHKKIFSAMNTVWAKGEPVDLVTLLQELKARGQADDIGGAEYLAQLVDRALFI